MKFESMKRVNKTGRNTAWISLDHQWGIKPGDWVRITVEKVNVPPEEIDDVGIQDQE